MHGQFSRRAKRVGISFWNNLELQADGARRECLVRGGWRTNLDQYFGSSGIPFTAGQLRRPAALSCSEDGREPFDPGVIVEADGGKFGQRRRRLHRKDMEAGGRQAGHDVGGAAYPDILAQVDALPSKDIFQENNPLESIAPSLTGRSMPYLEGQAEWHSSFDLKPLRLHPEIMGSCRRRGQEERKDEWRKLHDTSFIDVVPTLLKDKSVSVEMLHGKDRTAANSRRLPTVCKRAIWFVVVLFALLPEPALAHEGTGLAGGFEAGFLHPLTGLDHMLAMVSVGLWGAFLGRPLIMALPMIFPSMMVVGAGLAMMGMPLPPVELGIAVSVLALGAMILFAVRASIPVACGVVAMFALFHGYAHGAELPSAADPVGYSAGFVLSTGILHVVGIAIGTLRDRPGGQTLLRGAGGAIVLCGVFFLTAALRQ